MVGDSVGDSVGDKVGDNGSVFSMGRWVKMRSG